MPWPCSRLHQVDGDLVSGRVRHPELRRQGVDRGHGHAEGLSHPGQVVIDRDQRAAAFARQPYERRVDVDHAQLLHQLELDRRRLLELDQDVQAAPPAGPAARVRRVADGLQLAQDAVVQQDRAAHEAGGHQVRHAPVDQGTGVDDVHVTARRSGRCPWLHPHQSEDVLVPCLTQAHPQRAHHQDDEHGRGPRHARRHEEQRQHQQRRHDEARDEPDQTAGDLRGGLAPQLVLDAADGTQREPPDDTSQHEPQSGAQEDEQERPAGVLGGVVRAELEAGRPEQGDEDQPNTLDHTTAQRDRARLALAHDAGPFPI